MGRRSEKMNNLLDSMIEISIHETWWTQQQMDYHGITESDLDAAYQIMVKAIFPARYKEMVAHGIFCEEA